MFVLGTADISRFAELSDEHLVELIHGGDMKAQDFLINKYKKFVRKKTRSYFIIGGDREDLAQEGMIGLFKAIRDYRHEKATPFCQFAELCIKRQLITAIKIASRQKHKPLNNSISLSLPHTQPDIDRNSSEYSMLDVFIEDSKNDPEELVIQKEQRNYLESNMLKSLSEYEIKVLYYYLQGLSYADISKHTNKDVKSVDNALQRIKRKIDALLLSFN